MRAIVILTLALCGPAVAEKTVDAAAGTVKVSFTVEQGDLLAFCMSTAYRDPEPATRNSISRAQGVCVPADDAEACSAKSQVLCAARVPACPILPDVTACAQSAVDAGLCTRRDGSQRDRKRCARMAAAKELGGCSVSGNLAQCATRAARRGSCPESVPDPSGCLAHLEAFIMTKVLTRSIDRGHKAFATKAQEDQDGADARRAGVIE